MVAPHKYSLPEGSDYPPHFPRTDLVQTHHGLFNDCPAALESNLRRVAWKLEQMRAILSEAAGQECWVKATYGYRSPAENKACGSTATPSAHEYALAADTVPKPELFSLRQAWDVLRDSDEFMGGEEPVDQLIIERGCIHVGLAVPWHENKARGELRTEMELPDRRKTAQGKPVRTYPLFGVWSPR